MLHPSSVLVLKLRSTRLEFDTCLYSESDVRSGHRSWKSCYACVSSYVLFSNHACISMHAAIYQARMLTELPVYYKFYAFYMYSYVVTKFCLFLTSQFFQYSSRKRRFKKHIHRKNNSDIFSFNSRYSLTFMKIFILYFFKIIISAKNYFYKLVSWKLCHQRDILAFLEGNDRSSWRPVGSMRFSMLETGGVTFFQSMMKFFVKCIC